MRITPKGLFTEAALVRVMDGLSLSGIAALLKRFGGDISTSVFGGCSRWSVRAHYRNNGLVALVCSTGKLPP